MVPGAIVEIIAGVLLLARRRAYAERWFGEGSQAHRLTGS
jgi:hypothetical protein